MSDKPEVGKRYSYTEMGWTAKITILEDLTKDVPDERIRYFEWRARVDAHDEGPWPTEFTFGWAQVGGYRLGHLVPLDD